MCKNRFVYYLYSFWGVPGAFFFECEMDYKSFFLFWFWILCPNDILRDDQFDWLYSNMHLASRCFCDQSDLLLELDELTNGRRRLFCVVTADSRTAGVQSERTRHLLPALLCQGACVAWGTLRAQACPPKTLEIGTSTSCFIMYSK